MDDGGGWVMGEGGWWRRVGDGGRLVSREDG